MVGKPTTSDRVWPGLNDTQADGLACVICAADFYRTGHTARPVGRSRTGSQVFACIRHAVIRRQTTRRQTIVGGAR